MPNEGASPGSNPKPNPIESLKQTFNQRMSGILYKELTIENIENFADDALRDTISLTKDVVNAYKKADGLSPLPNQNVLNAKEQEDEAFRTFDLQNINEVLESIIEVKEKIDAKKAFIDLHTEKIDQIITPPKPNIEIPIAEGRGNFKEKKLFPRLLTLLYIIEHDFDLTTENVSITEGSVVKEMMRKTPYMRVEIPNLKRVVYICDEEGNASYVFNTEKLEERGISIENIDLQDKDERNHLLAQYPGLGIRLIQSSGWRGNMALALGEQIPETQNHTEPIKIIFEFKKKKEWLSFEDFQNEVRGLYPEQGAVNKWYHIERRNHPNWPAHPYIIYKNKGWVDWPELVGKTTISK